MNRVTISDVAVAAGVSMKSVSRVINREPNVSPRLAAKVEAAIASLGYVPDFAARSLAGGRSFTIGILYQNPSPNYTMKLQTGAYRACRAQGYHLLIEHVATTRDDIADQLRGILLNARIDGFILTPPVSDCDAVLSVLEERGIPYVRVAPAGFPGRSPSVSIDDEAAAREIAEHLVGLGHRHVGIINGPPSHLAASARRKGLVDVLEAHDLPAPHEAYGGFEFMSGIRAGLELLSAPNRPTAIFAGNDDSAAGVMAAAAQLGLKVPDDLSVAGFDDSWIALSVWPALTTIHQPIAEIAETAANLLIDRNGAMKTTGDVLLDFHLVIRGSTGVVNPSLA
jgi:LacI family transcriptional regulator